MNGKLGHDKVALAFERYLGDKEGYFFSRGELREGEGGREDKGAIDKIKDMPERGKKKGKKQRVEGNNQKKKKYKSQKINKLYVDEREVVFDRNSQKMRNTTNVKRLTCNFNPA